MQLMRECDALMKQTKHLLQASSFQTGDTSQSICTRELSGLQTWAFNLTCRKQSWFSRQNMKLKAMQLNTHPLVEARGKGTMGTSRYKLLHGWRARRDLSPSAANHVFPVVWLFQIHLAPVVENGPYLLRVDSEVILANVVCQTCCTLLFNGTGHIKPKTRDDYGEI